MYNSYFVTRVHRQKNLMKNFYYFLLIQRFVHQQLVKCAIFYSLNGELQPTFVLVDEEAWDLRKKLFVPQSPKRLNLAQSAFEWICLFQLIQAVEHFQHDFLRLLRVGVKYDRFAEFALNFALLNFMQGGAVIINMAEESLQLVLQAQTVFLSWENRSRLVKRCLIHFTKSLCEKCRLC